VKLHAYKSLRPLSCSKFTFFSPFLPFVSDSLVSLFLTFICVVRVEVFTAMTMKNGVF
jgi:hypothetical protein